MPGSNMGFASGASLPGAGFGTHDITPMPIDPIFDPSFGQQPPGGGQGGGHVSDFDYQQHYAPLIQAMQSYIQQLQQTVGQMAPNGGGGMGSFGGMYGGGGPQASIPYNPGHMGSDPDGNPMWVEPTY